MKTDLASMEYDAAEFLLQNQDTFLEKLKPLAKERAEFFPPSLYDVYLHQYEEKAYQVILDELAAIFNLSPEDRLRISKALLKQVAPNLLIPNKEK